MGNPYFDLTISPTRTAAAIVRRVVMLAAFVVALGTACSDNDSNTTIITTTNPSMTMPTTPSGPTDTGATDTPDSTGLTGATLETEASTTDTSGDSSSLSSTGVGTTSETTGGAHTCWPDEPDACNDDGNCGALLPCAEGECSCSGIAEVGADFCSVVRVLAIDAGVAEPYLGFITDVCMSGEDRCVVCFNLQNYCDQIADTCENLFLACGCVGDFYGVP